MQGHIFAVHIAHANILTECTKLQNNTQSSTDMRSVPGSWPEGFS